MNRGLFLTAILLFSFFGFYNLVFAANSSFGGKVLFPEASEITNAKSSGYHCDTPAGKSAQIRTKNGSFGYFIPQHVKSATRKEIKTGQSILGIISAGDTIVTCTREEDGKSSAKSISLKNITYYGNSAR